MKRAALYLVILNLIAMTAGCETDAVNVKVPDFEQKLVVTGFISPSEAVSQILVASNWPVFGLIDTDQPVGHLTGSLSDGIREVSLDTFKNGLQLDQSRFRIDYGKSYKVSIKSDLGLSVDAICHVPGKREFNISADTVWIRSRYGWSPDEKTLQLIVRVKDIPNEENFYSIGISGLALGVMPNGDQIRHQVTHYDEVRSDKGLDGQALQWQIDTGFRSYARLVSAEITIYLYHTEESYYSYHKSLETYHGGGNPFAESTPVYSNINGGLGVFTSYTIDSVVYSIR